MIIIIITIITIIIIVIYVPFCYILLDLFAFFVFILLCMSHYFKVFSLLISIILSFKLLHQIFNRVDFIEYKDGLTI